MYTPYWIAFGVDMRSYPVEYEQQRHRTGTSRSQTSVKSQKIKAMVFNKQNITLHGLHVHDGARF